MCVCVRERERERERRFRVWGDCEELVHGLPGCGKRLISRINKTVNGTYKTITGTYKTVTGTYKTVTSTYKIVTARSSSMASPAAASASSIISRCAAGGCSTCVWYETLEFCQHARLCDLIQRRKLLCLLALPWKVDIMLP